MRLWTVLIAWATKRSVPVDAAPQSELEEALRRKVEALEAQLESMTEALVTTSETLSKTASTLSKTKSELVTVTAERDKLRRAYELLKGQLELVRRRIFVAKAERIDTSQLEIEFAETQAKLEKMAKVLDGHGDAAAHADGTSSGDGPSVPEESGNVGRPAGAKKTSKGSGRPNLSKLDLPEERVEILDPSLEGKAERIGFDETCFLGRRRGGSVRIVMARATYKTTMPDESTEFVTADKPKEIYERGMLAPSFIAYLLTKKFRWGMPFHRISLELAAEGLSVDDSTMCRYAEHVGATLGIVVDAAAKEARETAFCLSTDATGIAIQPSRLPGGPRQACAKGHFFVVLADKDHVFFEYQSKHTSEAVCSMFRGFKGYIQADAHSVYDALFRGDAVDEGEKPPDEVACWSHARRKFWEAAIATKEPAAREALLRIGALFRLEKDWSELAPKQRHDRRQRVSRPMLDEFFAWAGGVFERVRNVRGPVATAFGYAIRQREGLRRFLEDGRLRLENNAAERALRQIAVGRNAWLFFGSGDHAQAAANIFSLIASCVLHRLDAEGYLADVIRVLPYWPRDRYLELTPKYWTQTRARLDEDEMKLAVGHVTVPPPAAQ
jgi:transposase